MDDVVKFTQELVRIRSTSDVGESAVADLVARRMRSFGWEPRLEEVAPGRPNVIAVIDGGGGPGPTLLFEGHTDVVTEGDATDWTVPPYDGQIRDGRLYGRGAADMKSGLAAAMYAARALQCDGPFPGRLVVAALVDEEGMMTGARAFARTSLATEIDAAIIAEPEDGEICAVAKGALRLRLDLTGAMAHGAMPQQARNPIPVVGRLLGDLAAYERELQRAHPAHEHLGPLYLTPTVAQAGTTEQLNVIPAHCTLGLDIRTIPDVVHKEVIDRVHEIALAAAEPAGVQAELVVVDDKPIVDTPRDHPVVTALVAAHEEVVGESARFGGVPGATDGTFLTHDAGIPSVVYGPGDKWIAHQADEWVATADIVRFTEVFTRAARHYLGS